jgi:O-antigen ligase
MRWLGAEPWRSWSVWLGGLLLAAAAYAAFAGGAIEVPAETRLQVGLAGAGLVAVVGLCAGELAGGRAAAAWSGVAALALLGLWSALSISWSVLPDASWLAANRAVTYAIVAALALLVAGSVGGARAAFAVGLAALSVAVALFALGGKILPGVEIGPFSLDPGDRFARLREPLDYWNALGLLCVMGAPACVWLAASRSIAPRRRLVATGCLTLLVLATALSYSRGAFLAYAVALGLLVAAGPRRLTRLAVGLGAIAAAGPAMLLSFTRHDLSGGEVPLAERIDGGLLLGAVLLASLAAVALGGRELLRIEERLEWGPRRARRAWIAIAAVTVLLLAGGAGALAVSDRGLTGQISDRIEELKQPGTTLSNEPERLISANGSSRYVWWQEALGAWADRPLAGRGAGSFPTLHYLYRRHEAPARSSHSLPLALASETGVLGLALGLGGLLALGAAAVARIRAARGTDRNARLVLLTAAVAWFTHSLYDWHWEIPGVTVPALIALAAAAAPSRPPRRARPAGRRRAGLAAGAAALAAAGLILSAALPSLSEDARLRSLELAAGGGSPAEAAEEAELAHRLNPLSVEPLFAAASIATSRGMPALAAARLEEAARTQPENWRAQRRLVLARTTLQQRDAALRAWRAWAEADPLLFRRDRDRIAAQVFSFAYPAGSSPTAFGAPPP